jgi:hypothetical protein
MEKLEKLFDFLKENRKYNKEVQTTFYKQIILPFNNKEDKITALLHHVVNTQSQPKIDKLFQFFSKIQENKSKLYSFNDFLKIFKFNENSENNYSELFEKLRRESGWGDKTAALFCKSIYHLHCGEYDSTFKIWDDIPTIIDTNDKFYLPVDAVIIDIFSRLDLKLSISFNGINKFLNNEYDNNEIEVWDDLWFWGFISQKSIKDEKLRKLEWNKAKYWALLQTNKDAKIIEEIRLKAISFIALINEK